MFLSVVRKTSKAASSAALGSSPLLSVSQPRSFVFLTMWSLVGAEGGNGAVAEDEVGHSREVFGHSSKLDHSKLVPRNAPGSRNVIESISWRQSTRAIGRHIGPKPFGGLPPN